MSYLVFARKYRPLTFDEIVGQEPIVTSLVNAISTERVAHAYLFSGIRGVGKTTTARILAKALNCVNGPTPTPCNACPSCIEITASGSIDVHEIDGASNNSVDAIRELRENINYRPSRDRYKVYIIDEVHSLSKAAFNALLKTLEEPPGHVVFIFATTDPRAVPDTILSRCQHYDFRRISSRVLLDHLRKMIDDEGIRVEPGALDLVVRMADGSLRDAQSVLDQVVSYCGTEIAETDVAEILGVVDSTELAEFARSLAAGNGSDLLTRIDRMVEKGGDLVRFALMFQEFLRNLLVLKVAPGEEALVSDDPERIGDLQALAREFETNSLLAMIELLQGAERTLRFVAQPRFSFEALALRLMQLGSDEIASAPAVRERATSEEREEVRQAKETPRREPTAVVADEPAIPTPTVTGDKSWAGVEKAFLEKVLEAKKALRAFLAHRSESTLEDKRLVFKFPANREFAWKQVNQKSNREILDRLATALLGREVSVSAELLSQGSGEDNETENATRPAFQDLVMQEKGVQSVLKSVGGKVVNITDLRDENRKELDD